LVISTLVTTKAYGSLRKDRIFEFLNRELSRQMVEHMISNSYFVGRYHSLVQYAAPT